jgi:GT2 family glycosyltransferase
MPAVSIAIPTLQSGDPLACCLKALRSQTFRDFEVIVIDNGNCEDLAQLGSIFPFRLLRPGRNLGFAAAVNLAIRNTGAPWIATLNDDTEPQPEWLANLLAAMQSNSGIGMCASLIRMKGTEQLDSAGMLICPDGSSRQRGHLNTVSAFPVTENVLCPSACAALYRRGMLDEIGGFDEDFFLYCEDTDLGLRAQWAGWRCIYSPGAIVSHRYSATSGAASAMKAGFVERNRLWVAIKNFPLSLLLLVPAASLARYVFQANAVRTNRGTAAAYVRTGHSIGSALAVIARAHWDTLFQLPALLRKRAACARLRKLRPGEFRRLLRTHSISPKDLAFSG